MESLIRRMMQLLAELSARLLRLRTEKARMRKGAEGGADIAGTLIDRLNQCLAESAAQAGGKATPATDEGSGASEASKIEHRPLTGTKASPTAIPPLAPGKRVPVLSQGVGVSSFQPPVGEQLEKQTFRYISQALVFARQGNAEAAEVYAQAAESALKLAVQYLPEEEYVRFKDEVISRLK